MAKAHSLHAAGCYLTVFVIVFILLILTKKRSSRLVYGSGEERFFFIALEGFRVKRKLVLKLTLGVLLGCEEWREENEDARGTAKRGRCVVVV